MIEAMTDVPPIVVNIDSVTAIERLLGERWGAQFKPLTPSMRPRGGSLGVNLMLLPPGRTACPFHSHQREDEAFFVLKGRGVLRYGDQIIPLRAGDCVSCPAGTGEAHQLANPHEDGDLVYLAIGTHDRDEVCVYPDSGKVLVRSLEQLGRLEATDYFEGEPRPPKIFEMAGVEPSREEGAPMEADLVARLSGLLKRAEVADAVGDEPIRSSKGLMQSLAQLGWLEAADSVEAAGDGSGPGEREPTEPTEPAASPMPVTPEDEPSLAKLTEMLADLE
jgi:uncharacterized cupin superfamily protein